jgi:cell division cycle 20-like protein 1 (cofactor of APC complex)
MMINNAGNFMKMSEKGPVWGLDEDLLFSEFIESDLYLPDFEKWHEPTKLKDNRGILNNRSIAAMEELGRNSQEGKKALKAPMDRFIPMRIDEEAACLLKAGIDRGSSRDQENIGLKAGQGLTAMARPAKSAPEKKYQGKSSQSSKRKMQLRILKFSKNSEAKQPRNENLRGCPGMSMIKEPVGEAIRAPDRSVEAPDLEDDFYINILDWSQKNVIAVSLASNVHLWDFTTGKKTVMLRCSDNDNEGVSCLKWSPDGANLLVGNENGVCQVFDPHSLTQVASLRNQDSRVGIAAWIDKNLFFTGSRAGQLTFHDLRTQKQNEMTIDAHFQEICGMDYCGMTGWLATGSNDNSIRIWDIRMTQTVKHLSQHKAAVKALAWNKHDRGVLLSGGGNKDKTLKMYSVLKDCLLRDQHFESQITGIVCSPISEQFVTTHGFLENDIRSWNLHDSSQPTAIFEGHVNRVIYYTLSPDGTHLLTGSGDETLKFWHVFEASSTKRNSKLSETYQEIR